MLNVLGAFFRLAWVILKTNRQNTNQLFKELSGVLSQSGFELSAQQKKRVAFYTAQSAITNHWFSLLRGYKASTTETKNALYLGAFTPIADDLMDGGNLTFEALLMSEKRGSADAVLFEYLYAKLKPLQHQSPLFEHYFLKAHSAQNESLKQLGETKLTVEQLKTISYNKGGYYTLLYRMVLQNAPKPKEENAIYTLGAIMQVLNDLFDLHKDFHNKSQSLVTNSADIAFVKTILEELESDFATAYLQLDYQKTTIHASFRAIMAIVTRGHVALHFYQNLQGKNARLKVEEYSREDLIVDMEKPINIWRNLLACKSALQKHTL